MTITAPHREPHQQQYRQHEEGPDVHTALSTHGDAVTTEAHGRRAALPCRDHDADLWFAELPDDVERAKELCLGCPLVEQCLAGALERREPWGVWGGQLLLQGVVVPRKRPRGRPRKTEVEAA
ncbi:WhiB family transcriptional regulator [Ornithinimicrobium sp. Y1847]|uniref:WhiB family transcriptional regulator n=1 Tax=unclassified Ornithinimicrobium TaxID=2615080 RepID=UPI003B67033E